MNYCLNCMHEFAADEEKCPACGGKNSNINNDSYCLPSNTILHGRYLIGKMLGQGGFGITYVGFDLSLGVKVAVKEYFPHTRVSRDNTRSNAISFSGSKEAAQKYEEGKSHFLKEARRLLKVKSIPSIVDVMDVFDDNNTAYIIMEFVDGITLKNKLLRDGVIKTSECLRLFEPLMSSLCEMHRAGIIHRDISPDNIMITPEGSLKLIDFGASKETSSGVSSEQVAKRGFSPAEQYSGNGSTGTWSDVYSLCATIYYTITGKAVPDAMDRVIEDTLNFNVLLKEPLKSAQIAALTDGLAVKPQNRIQTIDALMKALKSKRKPFIFFKKHKRVAITCAALLGIFIIIGLLPKDKAQPTTATTNSISLSEINAVSFGIADSKKNAVSCTELEGRFLEETKFAYTDSGNGMYNVTIDTDTLTDMHGLFKDCTALGTIDFGTLDTSSVTDMGSLFENCIALEEIDVSGFDTSSVTDMSKMFMNCERLKTLDVSGFETIALTDMSYMFNNCSSIKDLDLSTFDASGANVSERTALVETAFLNCKPKRPLKNYVDKDYVMSNNVTFSADGEKYTFDIPIINVRAKEAEELNTEIMTKLEPYLAEAQDDSEKGVSLTTTGIQFSWYEYGEVLSLVATVSNDWDQTESFAFNYDMRNDNALRNTNLIARTGKTEADFVEHVREEAEILFDKTYPEKTYRQLNPIFYFEQRDNVKFDVCFSMRSDIYVDSNGVIHAIINLPSLAGAEFYETDISTNLKIPLSE